jgi:hypothetical protein
VYWYCYVLILWWYMVKLFYVCWIMLFISLIILVNWNVCWIIPFYVEFQVKDGFVMLCACLKCCCILIWLKPYSVVTVCDFGKLNYPWILICTLIHVMLFRVENLFLRIVNFLWVSFCCVCVRACVCLRACQYICMYIPTYLLMILLIY